MKVESLIKQFNLEKEVEKFVKAKVKELAREKRHDFCFEGSHRDCYDNQPHIPHVVDSYQTVVYGWLEKFCLGKEGPLENGGYLHIVVESYSPGDAATPTRVRGYWFVE